MSTYFFLSETFSLFLENDDYRFYLVGLFTFQDQTETQSQEVKKVFEEYNKTVPFFCVTFTESCFLHLVQYTKKKHHRHTQFW